MERYTDWGTTPLAWYKFIMFVLVPGGILLGLLGLPQVFESYITLQYSIYAWVGAIDLVISLISLGTAVAAMVGLIQRKWFGPRCVLASYVVNIVSGLYLLFVGGVVLAAPNLVGQGIGMVASASIMFAVNRSYFHKRRALFTPLPERMPAVEEPANAGSLYTTAVPEKNSSLEQAGGYSTIYRETGAESIVPAAVIEKEPEDGVELLMKLQAEEETRTVIGLSPAWLPETPKGKRAPIWSVVTLGTLCVVLAVTAAVTGWQASEVGQQKNELSAQVEMLEKQVDALEAESREKDREALALEKEHGKLKSDYSDLFSEYSDALYYQNFLSKNIGFIVEGSNRYHTVDCTIYQAADEYWAHNIEYCIYLGYSKCPLCGKE